MAEFTVGTAGVMVAHLDDLDRIQGRNLVGGHAVPGAWDIEGGAFALGACLSGGATTWAATSRTRPTPPGPASTRSWWTRRSSHRRVPTACCSTFLVSQVTPYYDAASRGGWLGLGIYHNRADMLRSLLEGCAHEMRMVVDAFQSDIKGGITDLRLTGGGTKSDGFAQIMTDTSSASTRRSPANGSAPCSARRSSAPTVPGLPPPSTTPAGHGQPGIRVRAQPIDPHDVRRGQRGLPRM